MSFLFVATHSSYHPCSPPGEGPTRIHQAGDGGVSSPRAGVSAGEAADGALQPPGGGVGSDRPARAAGGAHTEPQAQTPGAAGVLCQGL